MILTPSVVPEVTCQTGSRRVWILNLVAQTSVLGRREVVLSRKASTVFLCYAFQRERGLACLSGRGAVGKASWSTLFSAAPSHPPSTLPRDQGTRSPLSPNALRRQPAPSPLREGHHVSVSSSPALLLNSDHMWTSCSVSLFFPKRLLIYSLNKLNKSLLANSVSGTGLGLGFGDEQNGSRHYSHGHSSLPVLWLIQGYVYPINGRIRIRSPGSL